MPTISLCMIVKNEEGVLSRVLNIMSNLVDEIIIVDTGSTDSTKAIAKNYTDKIYDFEWINDFSAARNYSYSKATMDYVMWLDADDILTEEDIQRFKNLINNFDSSVDVLMMQYNIGFDEEGNLTTSCFRERITRRSLNCTWQEPIHEYLKINGKIVNSDICITHKKMCIAVPGRNISIYNSMVAKGSALSQRGNYYYARELKDNGRPSDAIEFFLKFLSIDEGWVEDKIAACNELAKCYIAIGDRGNSLKAILRSFEYDTPRADLCCQLGYHYKDTGDYSRAVFWFNLASTIPIPENNWSFISNDCFNFIPYIELSVCYDKLGNIDDSIKANDRAAEIKPNNASVLYNKKYFKDLGR